MNWKYIAVIGDESGIPSRVVRDILDEWFDPYDLWDRVLVSGACPNGGVDIDGEDWAKDHRRPYLIFPPRFLNKTCYFQRNGWVAEIVTGVLGFIKARRVRAGAWNCIRQFLDLGKMTFNVFDQDGQVWFEEEYPSYIRSRIEKCRTR